MVFLSAVRRAPRVQGVPGTVWRAPGVPPVRLAVRGTVWVAGGPITGAPGVRARILFAIRWTLHNQLDLRLIFIIFSLKIDLNNGHIKEKIHTIRNNITKMPKPLAIRKNIKKRAKTNSYFPGGEWA